MALPLCLELPEIPDPIDIPMFGFDIGGIDVLDQLQPMLAPLMPLFQIIDTIVAVFNCMKAIPDAITSLDPSLITGCIPELGEKLSKLLALLPQLTIPRMIKQICNVLIRTLSTARNEFATLVNQLERIAAAIDRATNLNDSGLMAIIACAKSNAELQSANLGKQLASLGRLIGLINLLLALVGLPEIPKLSGLAGLPLDGILAPLDALIEILETVRDAIPVP